MSCDGWWIPFYSHFSGIIQLIDNMTELYGFRKPLIDTLHTATLLEQTATTAHAKDHADAEQVQRPEEISMQTREGGRRGLKNASKIYSSDGSTSVASIVAEVPTCDVRGFSCSKILECVHDAFGYSYLPRPNSL